MSVSQEPRRVELDSGYVIQGLFPPGGRTAHRLHLSLAGTGQGAGVQVHLDPNACTLDPFGETQGCTRIAVRVVEAHLDLVQEAEGRRLFNLRAADWDGPPMRLVLTADAAGTVTAGRLLVLGDSARIEAMYPLQLG